MLWPSKTALRPQGMARWMSHSFCRRSRSLAFQSSTLLCILAIVASGSVVTILEHGLDEIVGERRRRVERVLERQRGHVEICWRPRDAKLPRPVNVPHVIRRGQNLGACGQHS